MKFNKYFWVSTFIIIVILASLVWNMCSKQKEYFEQPKWEKTLKCLKFNNDDINTFKDNLLTGKDPKTMLGKVVNLAHSKGLDDKQIFSCLTGEVENQP